MLILSRKPSEKIIVGDEIVISVIEVRGDQVKIGIEAPRNVKVYRQEVFNSIQEENRRAASGVMDLPSIEIPEDRAIRP